MGKSNFRSPHPYRTWNFGGLNSLMTRHTAPRVSHSFPLWPINGLYTYLFLRQCEDRQRVPRYEGSCSGVRMAKTYLGLQGFAKSQGTGPLNFFGDFLEFVNCSRNSLIGITKSVGVSCRLSARRCTCLVPRLTTPKNGIQGRGTLAIPQDIQDIILPPFYQGATLIVTNSRNIIPLIQYHDKIKKRFIALCI